MSELTQFLSLEEKLFVMEALNFYRDDDTNEKIDRIIAKING